MVVPEEREGKSEIASEILRDSSKPADSISSRKGGRKEQPIQRKVSSLHQNEATIQQNDCCIAIHAQKATLTICIVNIFNIFVW